MEAKINFREKLPSIIGKLQLLPVEQWSAKVPKFQIGRFGSPTRLPNPTSAEISTELDLVKDELKLNVTVMCYGTFPVSEAVSKMEVEIEGKHHCGSPTKYWTPIPNETIFLDPAEGFACELEALHTIWDAVWKYRARLEKRFRIWVAL